MQTCQLLIKLKEQMNREYRSSGIYMATSRRFSEHNFLELAQISRELAQYSVTRFMRFYDFLKSSQQNPFIYQDLSFHDMSMLSIEDIIHEILFDYDDRNHNISEIENITMSTNNIKTRLFMEKMKIFYIDEAEILFSSFKDNIPSNEIKLEYEGHRLPSVVLTP